MKIIKTANCEKLAAYTECVNCGGNTNLDNDTCDVCGKDPTYKEQKEQVND